MVDIQDHARALGYIPSGLFILSAGRAPVEVALLVSFVQQVGFAPPAVTFAIQKGREHVLAILRAQREFCLAVVPEGARALLAQFAAGPVPGTDPFAGVDTAMAANGVRYPAAACAHLACELIGEADWSDHVVLCGRVTAGRAVPDAKPWVHLRKNGLAY